MDNIKRIKAFLSHRRSEIELIAASCGFTFSMILSSGFFLFKKTAYFDDSFIYLHIAANIVELGTARYFPIAESGMLLSSSPLRLFTLTPGFFALNVFDIPLRTIEAARFDYLCSGYIAFLVFLPFWTNRLKHYLLLGTALFLLSASLDTIFLMEGATLFLSLFTLEKLLVERTENYFALGISVLLIGLSRPELGVAAILSTSLIYNSKPKVLAKILTGLFCGFLTYWLLMVSLHVYPIPSTIWSKQITGKLHLFTDQSLFDILPLSLAKITGFNQPWVGWILIGIPISLSLTLSTSSIPILCFISLMLAISISMPGNCVWYSENFLIAIMSIMTAISIELIKRRMIIKAFTLGATLLLTFSMTLVSSYGKNKEYPWNENAPTYLAYQEVAKGFVGDGKYVINRFSDQPMRVRMCEIGIVSFFSGPNSWIYDVCGLIQIGNLKGASEGWFKYFYPSSFSESGDDQLARLNNNDKTGVIDVWALRNKEEAASAIGRCKFVDDIFCINQYR